MGAVDADRVASVAAVRSKYTNRKGLAPREPRPSLLNYSARCFSNCLSAKSKNTFQWLLLKVCLPSSM